MRVALASLALAVVAGCAEPRVTRIVDGRPVEGRYISEAAYALFARGAQAEVAGRLAAAVRAFEYASVQDPESPEIWTRLGALYCRVEPQGGIPPRAAAAFERARSIDPDHGPLYRERARCLATRPTFSDLDWAPALADADRALALDPDDLDTAMVRAFVLDRAGRAAEARAALRALAARRPTSAEPWQVLRDLAGRSGDAALAQESARRLAELAPGSAGKLPETDALATIDHALQAGDLPGAQRRALKQRLSGAEVALRAAALGNEPLAREQGALVLGADPADTSARIALIAAADLRGDVAALSDLMRSMPRHAAPPSPLGRWLFAEVLRRRVSPEAAQAWLGETKVMVEGDPLLAATARRVREALATQPKR